MHVHFVHCEKDEWGKNVVIFGESGSSSANTNNQKGCHNKFWAKIIIPAVEKN